MNRKHDGMWLHSSQRSVGLPTTVCDLWRGVSLKPSKMLRHLIFLCNTIKLLWHKLYCKKLMSRNVVGGFSFSICLILTVTTFRSCDWMSARSIFPVNVMTTPISEPIRHPQSTIRTRKWRKMEITLLIALACLSRCPSFSSFCCNYLIVYLELFLIAPFSLHIVFVRLSCDLTLAICPIVLWFDFHSLFKSWWLDLSLDSVLRRG